MPIDSRTGTRESWLDSARGFAMICVMLGHAIERMTTGLGLPLSGWLWDLRTLVYSFHVPLFFAVAGWLYAMRGAEESTGTFIRKRTLALLVPYLLFSLIVWAGKAVAADYVVSRVSLKNLVSVLITPFTYLWFIYVLYLISVSVRVLDRLIRNRCLLLAVSVVLGALSFLFPARIDAVNKLCLYLPVYVLGAVLGDAEDRYRRPAALAGLILFALTLPRYWTSDAYSAWWLVSAMTSSAALLWFFKAAERGRSRFLGTVGRHSIYIYILHPIIMNAVRMALMRLGVGSRAVWMLSLTSVSLILPLLYALAARRFRVLALPFEPGKVLPRRGK